jgi:hypothetical protein
MKAKQQQQLEQQLVGALRELVGGRGHLQDIRFGAFGTTKRKALGGHNAQHIADELIKRGFVHWSGKDDYFITESGRAFITKAGA